MSAMGCAAGLAIRLIPRPHWCQQPRLLLAGTLLLPSLLCRMYRYGSRPSPEAPCSLEGGPPSVHCLEYQVLAKVHWCLRRPPFSFLCKSSCRTETALLV